MGAPTYTQTDRPLAIDTPLGTDVLLLEKFEGLEQLCGLFSFHVEMLALATTNIPFASILGQSVTVEVRRELLPTRYFNGIVSRFSQGHRIQPDDQSALFIRYYAEIVPSFWLLTHKINTRIFQHISVLDILKQVLVGFDVSYQTVGTFQPRDYCTQYRESDFAFASRLMEEEGIYYYFKHSNGSHQMVLANTPTGHALIPGGKSTVSFEEVQRGLLNEERITQWTKHQDLRSGKSTLWDHCFEMPDNNLQEQQTIQGSAAAGEVSHTLTAGGADSLEIYDYPGRYAQRFDGVNASGGDQPAELGKIPPDGTRTVGIRMQEEAAHALRIQADSDNRQMSAGHKFSLLDHFNANGPYVVEQVAHFASIEGAYLSGGHEAFDYHNEMVCFPFTLPFRPPRVTPPATVDGTQVALVVGPPGEEIFTDKYGRVKVQFYWDRLGTKDQNSSCWIRVGTPWASKQWGTIHIPRIGMEVIVAFEEGDPDQPIIVGCVYNADNMPPYTLPAMKTQSGIKSRSTLHGTPEEFNELRFEDLKGQEDIYFHAQKDFHRYVEHDDDLKVLNDQTITITHNRTEKIINGNETLTIEMGNRVETLQQGNDSLTLDLGNRTEELKLGNDSLTLDLGNRSISLKLGNHSTSLDLGNHSTDVKVGNITMNADTGMISMEALISISLTVGGNSIVISQAGIMINGIMIEINGDALLTAQAPMSMVNGDGMLLLNGGVCMIN